MQMQFFCFKAAKKATNAALKTDIKLNTEFSQTNRGLTSCARPLRASRGSKKNRTGSFELKVQ